MNDQLVSIRMPKTLVKELQTLVQENHYLDLSEELRSIIRRHAQFYLEPQANNTLHLREELEKELLTKHEQLKKEALIKELQTLLEVQR